jgi:hypothetical protein
MTTDKMRVEIREKDIDFETFINNEALVKILFGKYPIMMGWIGISKDRDNWIDITLPEAIDGEKYFRVHVFFEDGKWQGYMMHLEKGYEYNPAYDLQITVY